MGRTRGSARAAGGQSQGIGPRCRSGWTKRPAVGTPGDQDLPWRTPRRPPTSSGRTSGARSPLSGPRLVPPQCGRENPNQPVLLPPTWRSGGRSGGRGRENPRPRKQNWRRPRASGRLHHQQLHERRPGGGPRGTSTHQHQHQHRRQASGSGQQQQQPQQHSKPRRRRRQRGTEPTPFGL